MYMGMWMSWQDFLLSREKGELRIFAYQEKEHLVGRGFSVDEVSATIDSYGVYPSVSDEC